MGGWSVFFFVLLVFWCYTFRKQKQWRLHGTISAVVSWLAVRAGVWLLANVVGPILPSCCVWPCSWELFLACQDGCEEFGLNQVLALFRFLEEGFSYQEEKMEELHINTGPGYKVRIRPSVFRSEHPFSERYAKTVVVDCSDGRFTQSDEEFLGAVFGEPYADELELPGGVAALHPLSAGSSFEVMVLKEKLRFLAAGHKAERIVLLAHEHCGHYADKYKRMSDEERVNQQITDLAAVVRNLSGEYSGLEVRAFYKRVQGGHIVFDEVLPD